MFNFVKIKNSLF